MDTEYQERKGKIDFKLLQSQEQNYVVQKFCGRALFFSSGVKR